MKTNTDISRNGTGDRLYSDEPREKARPDPIAEPRIRFREHGGRLLERRHGRATDLSASDAGVLDGYIEGLRSAALSDHKRRRSIVVVVRSKVTADRDLRTSASAVVDLSGLRDRGT